jgi:hypothetical protein
LSFSNSQLLLSKFITHKNIVLPNKININKIIKSITNKEKYIPKIHSPQYYIQSQKPYQSRVLSPQPTPTINIPLYYPHSNKYTLSPNQIKYSQKNFRPIINYRNIQKKYQPYRYNGGGIIRLPIMNYNNIRMDNNLRIYSPGRMGKEYGRYNINM